MKHIMFLMLLGLTLVATQAQADSSAAASGSASVGYVGASSAGIGSIDASTNKIEAGYINASTNVSEAADLGDTVPGVFAAGVTAGGSNPCIVSVGVGASGSGFGLNFARAYNDSECQIRESLRLMVAILPNNNDKGSQMLIRETACQSDVYWQAMERVYIATKDERFLCTNPRPDNKPIAIRDRAVEKVEHTASKAPVTTKAVVSNYNSHPFLDF